MRNIFFVLFCVCFLLDARGQSTLQVPSAAYSTIQSAMNAASSGDTIQVAAGTYVENLIWPAKVLHLVGAGPGVSILDGNNNGSVVAITVSAAQGSSIEGFTVTNGSGTPAFGTPPGMERHGGGIFLVNQTGPAFMTPMEIRNCHVTGNSAWDGCGVLVRYAAATFEDCVFDNNVSVATFPVGACALLIQAQVFHTMKFLRCSFRQHTTPNVLKFGTSWDPTIFVEDCLFEQNSGEWVLLVSAYQAVIDRNVFRQNTASTGVLVVNQGTTLPCRIDSCVFDGNNCAGRLITLAYSFPAADFLGNTIVNNVVGSQNAVVEVSGFVHTSDTIIKGNARQSGGPVMTPFVQLWSQGTLTYANSNIQGMPGVGPNVVDVAPMFVDAANGDYRLKPDSPMVDAGVANPTFTRSATDIRGRPRVQGMAADMGAYETPALAHHPAAAGRAGENNGGPFDVLSINGSSGGLFRRIEVPIGSSNSLEMAQPSYLSGAAQFAVYGILGEANFNSVTTVPLGIGDMMFAPAPMIPYLHPSFFMLVSTFGPVGPWQPLFWATPTPWASGPGPAIPFPFLMTVQGIIEEGPGIYVPTNALIFEVK